MCTGEYYMQDFMAYTMHLEFNYVSVFVFMHWLWNLYGTHMLTLTVLFRFRCCSKMRTSSLHYLYAFYSVSLLFTFNHKALCIVKKIMFFFTVFWSGIWLNTFDCLLWMKCFQGFPVSHLIQRTLDCLPVVWTTSSISLIVQLSQIHQVVRQCSNQLVF